MKNPLKRFAPKFTNRWVECAHCPKGTKKVQRKRLPRHTERHHPGLLPLERGEIGLNDFFQIGQIKEAKIER